MDTTENMDTTEIILDALQQAAAAHGVHEAEELGGKFDEQWPQWYAEHMTRTLAANGYQIVRVKQ
jgi:molecular chaperone GrpE (heat shock protein)